MRWPALHGLSSHPPHLRHPEENGMTLIDMCHGTHPEPPHANCTLIQWQKPHARNSRIRIKEHTCDCANPTYELCTAGGLFFIHRTMQSLGGSVHHESNWEVTAGGTRLWQLLLTGLAR